MRVEEAYRADRDDYYVRVGSYWYDVVRDEGVTLVEPEGVDIILYMSILLRDCPEVDKPPRWVYDALRDFGVEV